VAFREQHFFDIFAGEIFQVPRFLGDYHYSGVVMGPSGIAEGA